MYRLQRSLWVQALVVGVLIGVVLSVGVQVAWAGPSVKTNKSIYKSNETVTITGEGFEKSKSYALAIVWPDGKVYING